MAKYRIMRVGAQHRRKENKEWRVYGKGDVIELSEKEFNKGALSHLNLVRVGGDVPTSSKTPEQMGRDATNVPVDDEEVYEEPEGGEGDQTLEQLIDEVRETKTKAAYNTAREKVIAAEFLEEVPVKKADLLEALDKYVADAKAASDNPDSE